jgi:hypothetical protein
MQEVCIIFVIFICLLCIFFNISNRVAQDLFPNNSLPADHGSYGMNIGLPDTNQMFKLVSHLLLSLFLSSPT